jgi:peptidylprolyl isomerase
MRSPLLISFLLLLFTFSFLPGQVLKLKVDKEQKDVNGITYLLQKAGKGKLINKGDKVRLHYRGTLVDDRPFDNSYDRGQPFEFIVGMGQVIVGWDKAFLNLRGGDKVKLTIPPDLGYGNTPMPKIPEGSYLVFDIEILEVFPDFAPKPFSLKGKEKKTTSSGLEYYIIEEGMGDAPVRSKTVEVHYTGFLENGDIFDSSVLKGQPISFRLGVGMVIPGWDEGIGLLKPGGKAVLSIPYQLAYGENGRPPKIPAKARLIFNVELISVK